MNDVKKFYSQETTTYKRKRKKDLKYKLAVPISNLLITIQPTIIINTGVNHG